MSRKRNLTPEERKFYKEKLDEMVKRKVVGFDIDYDKHEWKEGKHVLVCGDGFDDLTGDWIAFTLEDRTSEENVKEFIWLTFEQAIKVLTYWWIKLEKMGIVVDKEMERVAKEAGLLSQGWQGKGE